MSDVHIKVLLPRDRSKAGTMMVEVDGRTVRWFNTLGRGSAGGGDTQYVNNGNTPTGEWSGTAWQSTGSQDANSYGPNGKLLLKPTGGNAEVAHDVFGRDLFRIHGGSPGGPGYWRGEGSLRATHGCLRLQDDDMKTLYNLILGAMGNEQRRRSEDVTVKVTVKEGEVFDKGEACFAEDVPMSRFFAP